MKMKIYKKSGFSLIEVNMAVLVIGLGLLVLFGLFPAGLKEGENGAVDTQCALFAESVLEGLRGEAHNKPELLDWNIWENINSFAANLTLSSPAVQGDATTIQTALQVRGPIEFPVGASPKTFICYVMQITNGDPQNMTRAVNLWVWSGQYVTKDPIKFIRQAEWYATKYVYGPGI
jgi:type II secretory pathway pseudopilin PulG